MILDRILERQRLALERKKAAITRSELEERISSSGPARDFLNALDSGSGIRIIAELKKGSPSRGIIREEYDPAALARDFQDGNAAALSVLTEEEFFFGHTDHLAQAREATRLPVLRKDFLIDPWQILESRAIGADAVLLIAAALDLGQIREFLELSHHFGMACLVEVHNWKELEMVLKTPAEIIGINNRDLATFQVDLNTTLDLVKLIPPDRVRVSESGISTREQVRLLEENGIDAILVGEALAAESLAGESLAGESGPKAKLRELLGITG